jgi:catechol 2,3-dioxygenase
VPDGAGRTLADRVMEPRDPEEAAAAGAPAAAEIPATTTLGAVELTVSDVARSIAYYDQAFGLVVRARDDGRVVLGVPDRDLLVLVEEPGARPADGYSGLYHFALLVPDRGSLAAWLAHAARTRVPLVGLSDHYVSEAIYLSDPDHHGIEIYRDRPRETWEGQVARMGTWPLDVQDLLGELDDPSSAPFDGLPAGTIMGHVHLRVADIAGAIGFYRDGLGFGLMAALGQQAAFLSAGGYHHHIGANTWESAGRPPAPPGSATLRHATVVLPDEGALEEVVARVPGEDVDGGTLVRDPSGNALVLTARD